MFSILQASVGPPGWWGPTDKASWTWLGATGQEPINQFNTRTCASGWRGVGHSHTWQGNKYAAMRPSMQKQTQMMCRSLRGIVRMVTFLGSEVAWCTTMDVGHQIPGCDWCVPFCHWLELFHVPCSLISAHIPMHFEKMVSTQLHPEIGLVPEDCRTRKARTASSRNMWFNVSSQCKLLEHLRSHPVTNLFEGCFGWWYCCCPIVGSCYTLQFFSLRTCDSRKSQAHSAPALLQTFLPNTCLKSNRLCTCWAGSQELLRRSSVH